MEATYRAQQLARASAECAKARAEWIAAKPGSRKWLAASDDMNFWQGKEAFFMFAKEAA